MASALRPALFRQALAAPAKRSLTTAALPAFRVQRTQPMLKVVPRAAFQTSTARQILPPLPQVMEGSVNDAASVPAPDPSHGAYHWSFERHGIGYLVVITPLTIIPFAAGSLNPLMDGAFISLLILHSYMGFQNCITDYFPKWRVPKIRKLADWANFLFIFICGWGWYEFETNDVGLTEGVKRIWKA